MSHLTLESLARLVDEAPEAMDAEHLSVCAECRAEVEALREQTRTLGELPDLEGSGSPWPFIEARLRREGLVRSPAFAAGRSTMLMRLAASLVLFLGGTLAGASIRSPGPARIGPVAAEPESASPAREVVASSGLEASSPDVAAFEARSGAAAARSTSAAAPAFDVETAVAATSADAERMLQSAERAYLTALSRYAELAGPPPNADPVARLAALEGIVLTTRAALNKAPADPVINGYHLTALAQREAMLRQIAANTDDPWF